MAGKRMTKAQVVSELAEKTDLTKKQVLAVMDGFQNLIKRELGNRGPGEFVIPDLLKLKVKKVPAKKARKGINPFTGEQTTFKAKPASKKIRATPLKKLKDLIN